MRIVRRDGVVFAPLDGVPGVKSVGAQGLHDVVLDPDFARNRTLYFNYFAPPPGETPGMWPIEFFYDNVWKQSIAERRAVPGPSCSCHTGSAPHHRSYRGMSECVG